MSGINAVLKLKEQAEEDIYFARLDREIIKKLHQKAAADAARSSRQPAKTGAADEALAHRPDAGRRPAN